MTTRKKRWKICIFPILSTHLRWVDLQVESDSWYFPPKICASHTSLCGFFTMLSVLLYLLYNLILETVSDIASGCCHHCLSTCFFFFCSFSATEHPWLLFDDVRSRGLLRTRNGSWKSFTRYLEHSKSSALLTSPKSAQFFVCLPHFHFWHTLSLRATDAAGSTFGEGVFPSRGKIFDVQNEPTHPAGLTWSNKKERKLRMNHCCLDDQANVTNEWIFV